MNGEGVGGKVCYIEGRSKRELSTSLSRTKGWKFTGKQRGGAMICGEEQRREDTKLQI